MLLDFCPYCLEGKIKSGDHRIWAMTPDSVYSGCSNCMQKRIRDDVEGGYKLIGFYENVQPNKYSCVASAFASVMGFDVDTMISLIGHDGSRKIGSEVVGFDESEIVPIALNLGFAIVRQDTVPCYGISDIPVPNTIFDMSYTPGVVRVAQRDNDHAFAVCRNGDWYDPTTGVYVSPKKNIVSYFSVHRLFEYGVKKSDFRMEVTGDLF